MRGYWGVFDIGTGNYVPPEDCLAAWRHHTEEMWFPPNKRPFQRARRSCDRCGGAFPPQWKSSRPSPRPTTRRMLRTARAGQTSCATSSSSRSEPTLCPVAPGRRLGEHAAPPASAARQDRPSDVRSASPVQSLTQPVVQFPAYVTDRRAVPSIIDTSVGGPVHSLAVR